MPEGDSLARVERRLAPVLDGIPLSAGTLRVPRLSTIELRGRVIDRVHAYGKHLFMDFAGGDVLHSHLLMEGRWSVLPRGRSWGVPAAQVRAVLETDDAMVLGTRLGILEALTSAERDDLIALLGPDPIHAWDATEALRRLVADPHRPLGAALLDQRVVAGIGNIFRSELLFHARLDPWAPVGSVAPERLRSLLDETERQLRENAGRPSRRTTAASSRERYWVYGRAGRPCPRGHGPLSHGLLADAALQRGRVGGDPSDLRALARDVYFCVPCQGVDPAHADGPGRGRR